MSIKDFVEGIENLLNELMSELLRAAKDFCSWLYNKEWSVEEIGWIFIIVIIIVVFNVGANFLTYKLENWSNKNKGKGIENKKDKTEESVDNKQGFKRLRNIKKT